MKRYLKFLMILPLFLTSCRSECSVCPADQLESSEFPIDPETEYPFVMPRERYDNAVVKLHYILHSNPENIGPHLGDKLYIGIEPVTLDKEMAEKVIDFDYKIRNSGKTQRMPTLAGYNYESDYCFELKKADSDYTRIFMIYSNQDKCFVSDFPRESPYYRYIPTYDEIDEILQYAIKTIEKSPLISTDDSFYPMGWK